MNDYDNNYGSENVNGEVNGGAVQENTDEKENTSAAQSTSAETNENVSGGTDAANETSHDGYTAYSNVGTQNNSNASCGYPYGAQNGTQGGAQGGAQGHPYGAGGAQNGAGGYPYGAQGGAYNGSNGGAYNGGYQQQGNPYPYSNGMNRNNGYAYPPQNGGSEKKGSKKGKTAFVVIVSVLLIGALIGFFALLGGGDEPGISTPDTTNKGLENVGEISSNSTPARSDADAPEGSVLSASAVYRKVKNSSVGILVYSGSSLASEGSGVIFTEDTDGKYTYIITCAHVISDSGVSIMVQLADEKEYKAQLVGYDTVTDIGVLRIEATGLQKAEIGDSSVLSVGETVYAIGNPGGVEFANSFTNGMVSAIDRPVSSSKTGYTMECIQHTAAINPGNSGGALVNEYGQLIGINSMKIVSDEYEGMGFAVPSSVFVKVVNEIIANGYVTNRPKLGITYIPASSQQTYAMYAAIKGLPAGTIVIYSISDDSSFKDTKAQKGDMIIAVNGKSLDSTSTLSEIVEKSNVGDKLTLTLVRLNVQDNYSAEQFDVTVTLVENRGDTYASGEEDTTAQNDFFGGSGGNGGSGSSGDDAYDYFKDYFDRYFGGNGGR